MNTRLLSSPWLHPVAWQPLRWLQACWQAYWSTSERDDGLDELIELDAGTLDDIGAPQRLLARARARRDAQQRCREDLLAGSPSAGWRHW